MSLKPVVVVDLLGREKFCIAFGFVVLFQGIGATIGPPLAGLNSHICFQSRYHGRIHCLTRTHQEMR